MKRFWLWAPLAGFVIFFAVVAFGLISPADRQIASKMVGKPLPAFDLPAGVAGRDGLATRHLATGQPRLLNVFASWCVPCVAEAPILMELKRQGVKIDAIAIRDRPEDVAGFLARNGDPYERIGSDTGSRVQLAMGSSGVPETFVVDGKGVIRHQHIGDIRPENVPEILAELEKAR
jgi:cytochrome c biogenesis protein CcmG/thiol:disulfide interchange protein DsbE